MTEDEKLIARIKAAPNAHDLLKIWTEDPDLYGNDPYYRDLSDAFAERAFEIVGKPR